MSTSTVDFEAVKGRQQATWGSGNYAVIGTTLQIVGEALCEAVDVSSGERVLDVAAGNGNVSLAAARRGCEVVATDYVGALLEGTVARAAAEGLHIETREADAEALPYADDSFDVVLSTFGVMFTPNQERSSSELQRVCRPGGRVGLANWTPTGFIGQMFKIVGGYVPPPEGVRSPLQWGTEERLAELFAGAKAIDATVKQFVFRYRSAEHWLATFREFYGPTLKAFAALDDEKGRQMEAELLDLARSHNRAPDGTLHVPSDYIEAVITVGS
jgi:ubiquinone/menaquinone biosynthesis C-methylase UbiE